MASWILIPCLEELFKEFDKIAPNRDHASDGKVGDSAHSQEVSDHNPDETGNVPEHDADSINEVHAIDVDKDLNANFTMEDVVQFLLSECRKNNPNGTDRGRLKYIIFNRRIWEAKNGWAERTYTGQNPHDKHAHFSAEYDTSYESDTNTWGLIEKFGDSLMGMSQAEFNTLFAGAVSEVELYNKANTENPKQILKLYDFIVGADTTAVDRIEKKLDTLTQLFNAHVTAILEGNTNR